MKKSEIIDGVSELVQDSSGGMRALISRWVNLVLDDIASRGSLASLQREETTPLQSGQRNYEMPTQTDHVFKLYVPAWGWPTGILRKINHDEYVQKHLEDGDGTGQPKYYAIFANKTLRIHPPAAPEFAPASPTIDQKLHLMKYKDIQHLADTDDITEIKVKHIPVVIFGAYHFGARFDSLGDVADAEGKYERGILRIIGDQHKDLDAPRQVPYRDLG